MTAIVGLATPMSASGHRQTSHREQLVAYGATRKAWAANHVPDPNPKLFAGCCFLPKQRDGQDRYYSVQYDHGRVFAYAMHFAPRITATKAKRLMRNEVPADARVTAHARKATCEQFVYRSATLKAATGYGKVGVEFSANGAGGRYRGIVGDVIIGPYTTNLGC